MLNIKCNRKSHSRISEYCIFSISVIRLLFLISKLINLIDFELLAFYIQIRSSYHRLVKGCPLGCSLGYPELFLHFQKSSSIVDGLKPSQLFAPKWTSEIQRRGSIVDCRWTQYGWPRIQGEGYKSKIVYRPYFESSWQTLACILN